MSEAYISRASGGGSMSKNEVVNIVKEYINSQKPGGTLIENNGVFIAPKTGEYEVMCFGGGGGGGGGAFMWDNYDGRYKVFEAQGGGGGSGYFNNGTFNLNEGDEINIIIGAGGGGGGGASAGGDPRTLWGSAGTTGGTTIFGNYLSATGGGGGGGGGFTVSYDVGWVYKGGGGGGGSGYHSGSQGHWWIYKGDWANTVKNEGGGNGVGGNGVRPPSDLSGGPWSKGGSANSGTGSAGCIYISWT